MSYGPARLTGSYVNTQGYLLYVGPLVETALHAHHAAQIVLAPDGLAIADVRGSTVMSFAAIPPRALHAHGPSDHAVLLLLDGDSAASRRFERSATQQRESWQRSPPSTQITGALRPDTARALVDDMLRAVDLELLPPPRHPAVRRMCRLLSESESASLAVLSRRAGLSARQMRHAFARDVGLPMRGYVRWRHLRRAVEAIEAGASLTAAAIEAGFADGAHLSRVFRTHFGISPKQALGAATWRADTRRSASRGVDSAREIVR